MCILATMPAGSLIILEFFSAISVLLLVTMLRTVVSQLGADIVLVNTRRKTAREKEKHLRAATAGDGSVTKMESIRH